MGLQPESTVKRHNRIPETKYNAINGDIYTCNLCNYEINKVNKSPIEKYPFRADGN